MELPLRLSIKNSFLNVLSFVLILFFVFTFFATVTSVARAQNNFSQHVSKISFATKKIKLGSQVIQVELAESPAQLERGLMYRTSLKNNQGMLFVFPTEQNLSFWMKNTFIDLSIGYFNKNKKLVDIQEMKATTELQTDIPNYPSREPAQFALEMNAGWFKKNNIKLGDSFKYIK